jgi:putative FmdB family regulatory protein
MPIYEYLCRDCRTTFDTLRSISQADDPIECTNCHSMNTTRAISLFAAHSVEPGGGVQTITGGNGGGCTACSTPTACSTCGLS